jgi:hypothetical protein
MKKIKISYRLIQVADKPLIIISGLSFFNIKISEA